MTTPLVELMGRKFTIPDYQRGYRWEKQEVTELLDDLWDFCQNKESGDFYCLQPIVLQRDGEGGFNVLDGQQRLTTLYILLVYLEDMRKEIGYNQSLFSLSYKTRPESEEFLAKKLFIHNEVDRSNIDFFYICKAYQSIDSWFQDEKHIGAKYKLIPILLDDNTIGAKQAQNRNVRIIEYVVEDAIEPIDVFIRLNVGKIPLTDAELTKALLLQSDKYSSDELEYNKLKLYNIATEWDNIESILQIEDFWYFLNDKSKEKPTHIEFIFDMMADRLLKEKKYYDKKPSKYSTFLIFSNYLEDLMNNGINGKRLYRIEAVEKIWKQITEYFEYFKEWFYDRTLYHYIGFILTVDPKNNYTIIDSLIAYSQKVSKTHFIEYLEKEIANLIKAYKPIGKLVYESEENQNGDKSAIHKILLIHNVYSTLKSDKEKARFPFYLYKKEEKWSLEHIYAQNSESITNKDKQNSWLDDHIKSLSNNPDEEFQKLVSRMEEMKSLPKIEQTEFDKIMNDVLSLDKKNISGIHSINNLCLLDSDTNSQLNNSVFDVKREKIKKRELKGFYIPVCTRNVFLKAYTEYPKDNVYWREEDRKGYMESIRSVYNHFIKY
jgi:hypothetical protein